MKEEIYCPICGLELQPDRMFEDGFECTNCGTDYHDENDVEWVRDLIEKWKDLHCVGYCIKSSVEQITRMNDGEEIL